MVFIAKYINIGKLSKTLIPITNKKNTLNLLQIFN